MPTTRCPASTSSAGGGRAVDAARERGDDEGTAAGHLVVMPWNAMKSNRCEVVATALDDGGTRRRRDGRRRGRRAARARRRSAARRAAEVAIDHHSPHRPEAWGRVLRRLGPASPDRVAPACPAFGRCGGCTWQHLAYPAQLAAKHRRVELALADVRALEPLGARVAEVRPSPAVLGYRNKGKYVVGRAGDRLVLGAYAPRSHDVVDTLGCRVVAPIIDEVATWVRGAAERARLVAYDERRRDRRAALRDHPRGGRRRDGRRSSSRRPPPRAKLEQRRERGRAAPRGPRPRRDRATIAATARSCPSGSRAEVLLGHGHLVEQLAGVPVEVGAGEFLQVNRAQAAAMYARVAELAEVRAPGVRAVDLFAGLGGIGLHLARAGAEVDRGRDRSRGGRAAPPGRRASPTCR